MPEVPTTAELGVPAFDARIWYAILAPTGTPGPVVARLRDFFAGAIAQPAMQQRLAAMHYDPVVSSPEEFARFMQSEAARYTQVMRVHNVRMND
jgi:tripartite-type tricarboxylate transporter receptor subunit TctC